MKRLQKNSIFLGLLFLILLNSSCISIIEKFIFNKNGGGQYSFTLDMSELSDMIKAMGTDEDTSITSIVKNLEKRSLEFDAISGISNTKLNNDQETAEINLTFDFSDIDALNKAINEFFKDEGSFAKQEVYFSKDKNKITRSAIDKLGTLLSDGDEVDEDSIYMLKMMMSEAFIKTIMEFDSDVKSVNNNAYEVSSNKRSIEYIKYIFKDEDNGKKVEATITLKK
jgi:hypothetical protein